jgi:hypothetical protein
MKKRLKFLMWIVALILLLPAAASCTSSQDKTYTLKHNGISFSFEYPSGYKKILSYIQDNPAAPIGVRFAINNDPVLMLNIAGNLSEKNPDLNAAATIAGSHTPQQEIERTSLTIGGTTGVLVAYVFSDTQLPSAITREVFFNVNGILWNISTYSSAEKADEAKLVFEHMIDTFTVLR